MEILDIVALVGNQPFNDIPVLVLSEIQVISTDMPVLNFVVTPKLVASVHIQQDKYYEVFPLLVVYQETVTYSEVFLTSDTYKRTGLYHNLIMEGHGLWLANASSLNMLIISLYKTRGRFFLRRWV